jgi:hypothetical protein
MANALLRRSNKSAHNIAPKPAGGPAQTNIRKLGCRLGQERESRDSPMLKAFCRVAPSVLLSLLAILDAAVFFFASVFSSRTSVAVQARRFFDFLAINPPFQAR